MSDQTLHIFLNGEMNLPEFFFQYYTPGEIILAVDGGLRFVQHLGIKPDILVGDLDSIDESQLKQIQSQKVIIKRFSPHKDETDFELALLEVENYSWKQIRVYGGLGGRLDHTIANLSIAGSKRYVDRQIIFTDTSQEVFFTIKGKKISGKPGDLISLIPWGGDVTGIFTDGLEYPLKDETLYFDGTRGISNIMNTDSAEIGFDSGRLLCVHQKQS